MSTTRWIIETDCEHGATRRSQPRHGDWCPGLTRVVVDPANLPLEAIQRAAQAIRKGWEDYTGTGEMVSEQAVEAAIKAFLLGPVER